MKRTTLPSPADFGVLDSWARNPSIDDAEWPLRVLRQLMRALPAHLPVYCYGTREYFSHAKARRATKKAGKR